MISAAEFHFENSALPLRYQRIVDIAEAVDFRDLSQFNRQFKTYFGTSPRAFRSFR